MPGDAAAEQLRASMVAIPAAKLAAGEVEQALAAVDKFIDAIEGRPAGARAAFAPIRYKLLAVRACARGLLAASAGVDARQAARPDVGAALAALEAAPPPLGPSALAALRTHLAGLLDPEPVAARAHLSAVLTAPVQRLPVAASVARPARARRPGRERLAGSFAIGLAVWAALAAAGWAAAAALPREARAGVGWLAGILAGWRAWVAPHRSGTSGALLAALVALGAALGAALVVLWTGRRVRRWLRRG